MAETTTHPSELVHAEGQLLESLPCCGLDSVNGPIVYVTKDPDRVTCRGR